MKSASKEQRVALIGVLRRLCPDVGENCGLSWLIVPDLDQIDGPLGRIFTALTDYRGYTVFATSRRALQADVVSPSQQLIVEYDERQHFTKPRATALELYPPDVAIGFDRTEWIAHCNTIAAKDDDPPYRDEQRAFYGSVRDLLAPRNGYRVIRLKHGAQDWRTCDVGPLLSDTASR
jgi:hypothetical protein